MRNWIGRNWKTTGLGLVAIACIVGSLVMVWYDKITMDQAREYVPYLVSGITALALMVAKDHDK